MAGVESRYFLRINGHPHWFSDAGITPNAFGTLFILDQQYLGTPNNLSAATLGYLSESISIAAGVYNFPAAFIVQPNTQYFLYANAFGFITGGFDVPGENSYGAGGGNFNSVAGAVDHNYRLSGSVVPAGVPEPSTLLMLGTGLIWLVGFRKRKFFS